MINLFYLDTSDKELTRDIKREADEYKRKYLEIMNQNNEVKKERDELRSQKYDEVMKVSRISEQEKSSINDLKSEIDRLKFKLN
jgi:uncharacterized coiled-coil DUF342 family protein